MIFNSTSGSIFDTRTYRTLSLIILCSLGVHFTASGQSPYRTKWDKELVITGAGITTLGMGAYLKGQITLFTPDELERLDWHNVIGLDRQATQLSSQSAGRASDYFMNGSIALPLLFLAGQEPRRHFGQIAIMYGETVIISTGLTGIIKYAVHRPRPFVYNGEANVSSIQSVNSQSSFVSGHTSAAASATFFFAKVYSDFYPESKWKPVVWVAAAVAPAITGYFRIRAGKHYPTDVIGGYALGAAIGYLVPVLHRNRSTNDSDITLVAVPNGVHLSLQF